MLYGKYLIQNIRFPVHNTVFIIQHILVLTVKLELENFLRLQLWRFFKQKRVVSYVTSMQKNSSAAAIP